MELEKGVSMLTKREKLDKYQKDLYKMMVNKILADFYYDRESIPCDCLKEIGLFLYKYSDLGPKGTDQVALCLYKDYNIIENNKKKGLNFLLDKEGHFLSLGEMERRSKIPHYTDVYYDIEKLTQKTLFDYPADLVWFNFIIFKISMKMAKRLATENMDGLNYSFQFAYGTDIVNYLIVSTPEERYRHVKEVILFLKKYFPKTLNELSGEGEASMLFTKLEVDTKVENIEKIKNTIFKLNQSLTNEDKGFLRQRILTDFFDLR